MRPLTFREVADNEEASGRFFLRRRPTLDGEARTAFLAAERQSSSPCPICGKRTRIERVFTNADNTDAQAYAACWHCGHMEGI